jgi:foldase protein PrsA
MKHLTLYFVGAAIALFTLANAGAQAPSLEKMDTVQRALPDGPVALVDGKPVSKEDFLFLYRSQLARAALALGEKDPSDEVRIKAGIGTLAELIQREILSQFGTRRKVKVSQSEVQAAYDEQLKILVEEFSIEGKSPTEQDILKKSGQTRDGALQDIHKAILVEKASEALANDKKLQITSAEARDFFDKNKERFQRPGLLHLKQIFVRAQQGKRDDDAEWTKAEKAIKKAQARFQVGESFEGVAKSMSDGRDAEQGGDMGMRPTQSIPPIYVEKAGSMEIGQTSEPFKSDQGWHIIRLEGREGASDVPFEEAEEWIKDRLLMVKTAAAVEEYCQPILGDQKRVQIFLQLHVPERQTANRES